MVALSGCKRYDTGAAGQGGQGGGAAAGGGRSGSGGSGGGGGKASRKFPVRVSKVATEPVQYAMQAVGNLVETDRYSVPARVSGVIEAVAFQEGDEVTTGQELARVDYKRYEMRAQQSRSDAPAKAAAVARAEAELADAIRESSSTVESARIDYELAESEFQRRSSGRTDNFTSAEEREQFQSRYRKAQTAYRDAVAAARTRTALAEAELVEARTALASSQAALALAEDDLQNAVIRAPIEAVVQERVVTNGQYVNPGTTAAMMVQTDPLRLRFTVPESRAQALSEKMKVSFSVQALPGQTFEGEVYALGNISDPKTREVTCWARVPNPDGVLRPGYFSSVSIVTDSKSSSIVVPLSSVLPTELGMVVYVIQDQIAVRKQVKTGLQVTGDAIEIVGGLEPGELLVVEGMESLQENVPVQILQPSGGTSAATGSETIRTGISTGG